jgi:hypothetical protein
MRGGLLALAFLVGACGPATQTSGSYSFEGSLQGWTPGSLDVGVSTPVPGWSISASSERSFAGSWSARVFLDNQTEAGKIWISRTYRLLPNRSYDVHVELALGTSDPDGTSAFRVLAGAAPSLPATGDDAISLARDDTANGGSTDVAWLFKQYDSVAATDKSGQLTAVVGIWGTAGGARTYYFDTLAVEFTERP